MKKDKFKKVKNLIAKQAASRIYKHPMKATAELEASKDPQAYIKKMHEPSIKKVKGVAF